MNFLNRALVALDFTEMDDQLISYSRLLSELLNLEKIYFVHVIPDFFFSNQSEIQLAEGAMFSLPIDEFVKEKISKKVNKAFSNNPNELSISVDVVEGSPYDKILHWVSFKQIDLLIVGRKQQSGGSGITALRVAHRADCHTLFVPENADLAPDKIMVPIDFSINSANAIRMALNFKKILPETVVEAVHAVNYLPTDYHFGLNENPDYLEAFRRVQKEKYETMIKKYQLPKDEFQMTFIENYYNKAARELALYARKEKFNLVIMGAQGHSTLRNFFYGSVTESFVNQCEDIPIFVVR
jgi:nucleotide-binding universal stress UspA family protein